MIVRLADQLQPVRYSDFGRGMISLAEKLRKYIEVPSIYESFGYIRFSRSRIGLASHTSIRDAE